MKVERLGVAGSEVGREISLSCKPSSCHSREMIEEINDKRDRDNKMDIQIIAWHTMKVTKTGRDCKWN